MFMFGSMYMFGSFPHMFMQVAEKGSGLRFSRQWTHSGVDKTMLSWITLS